MIELRNPIYKVKERDSTFFQKLTEKDLVGVDLRIQGETIPIGKKQKCIVAHIEDCWWVEHEDFVEPHHVNLYSVNDIMVKDGKLFVRFSYQNGCGLDLEEERIIALVHVRKRAKREDEDIQQLLISMAEEISW